MKVNTDALAIGGVTIAAVALFAWKVKKSVDSAKAFSKMAEDVQRSTESENINGWKSDFQQRNRNVGTHVNPDGVVRPIRDVN